MEHFKDFPRIEYCNNSVVNIMVRGKIKDAVKKQNGIYYNYTVRDNDRPDILASKYYGNPRHTWVLFYANDIFDPRHDWVKSSREFGKLIKNKYGTLSLAQQTIHHYLLDNEYIIDESTFLSTTIEASRKKSVSCYEYEWQLNEDKRVIVILDATYLRQLVSELVVLFK